jgi:hypothetical protein
LPDPSVREYAADPSAREYAADTVDPEPVSTSASSASTASSGGGATGRAAVKEPLWPTQPATGTTESKPAKTSRFRKGKNTD